MTETKEVARLLAIKSALISTTNTVGWKYIRQIADNVVKNAVQAAIDADDPKAGESLRQKAKALQEGLRDLFNTIETSKQFGTEQEPEWFSQLSFDEPALTELE